MKANKVISKQALIWKCIKHPNVSGDFIYLDGEANDRVLCFNCVQKQKIQVSNLISISQILAAHQNEILEAYPPLKDQGLSDILGNIRLEQQLDEITVYFKKLREDFEREVKAAEQRAKDALIKQDKTYQDLLEGYMRIAELEKLKNLIVSDKESAEKDLDEFIKEKWRKAEENRKLMADLINQYEGEQWFWHEEPIRIAQVVIEKLEQINFFQQSLKQTQFTITKSTIGTSQSMEITKVDNSIWQIKQGIHNVNGDQVFLDPILDPLKKYILHIEVEMKIGNSDNCFLFGLTKDAEKDNNYAYTQNICYFDGYIGCGLTKIIKGGPMQSRNLTGKHSFEVRIYLTEKYLRVACLPDYSSVVELDDSNKIDPNMAYRFFLAMAKQGDMMRITNSRIVSKFDEKM